MRHLVFLLTVALLSCTSTEDKTKESKKELLSTDRAFSALSAEKGMNEAFLFYAASDLIKMQEGRFPVIGKEDLINSLADSPDSIYRLTWEPVKAEVSRSGDLGYTFGNWELVDFNRETIRYGNYITIWRKQKDGTWRWVLDGGNTTPRPE